MAVIPLENEMLRVYIDPEYGTSIKGLYAHKGDAWLPLMPDVREPKTRLDASSFLMIPYSNRIENGAFTFQGQTYHLEGMCSESKVRITTGYGTRVEPPSGSLSPLRSGRSCGSAHSQSSASAYSPSSSTGEE